VARDFYTISPVVDFKLSSCRSLSASHRVNVLLDMCLTKYAIGFIDLVDSEVET